MKRNAVKRNNLNEKCTFVIHRLRIYVRKIYVGTCNNGYFANRGTFLSKFLFPKVFRSNRQFRVRIIRVLLTFERSLLIRFWTIDRCVQIDARIYQDEINLMPSSQAIPQTISRNPENIWLLWFNSLFTSCVIIFIITVYDWLVIKQNRVVWVLLPWCVTWQCFYFILASSYGCP